MDGSQIAVVRWREVGADPHCENCQFWVRWTGANPADPFGDCRRSAPVILLEHKLRDGALMAVPVPCTKWPSTRSGAKACGDFAPCRGWPVRDAEDDLED